ncbi:hypothetical protein [Streptomyces sp. NBC_00986]|uniref:hypothetical protein n=1 Tax=Streptomyces sp. NBC_00986 TaxID=2903702 RepID=UPI0038689963|nr:hypothetical protein OG504_45325 [Streptomyces sp. NBC_00986]
MISLAQVVAAIATGAMLPIAALLGIEMHRLRQRSRADDQIAGPPTPERVVDDDAERVEAIARLAAARFDLFTQEPDNVGTAEADVRPRSKAHLTLVSRSPRPGKKRSSSVPASENRRPLGYRPDVAVRTHRPVRRD